jgi:ribosomal protein S18 acetylase RimI-like enzyme
MAHIEFLADAEQYADDIRELLVLTDEEFHPPLSGRDGPTQTSDLDTERNDAIDDYLDEMMAQPFLLALDDDRVVGVLAFRHGYEADALGDFAPSNYASTLVVHPDHRRRGYARRMYDRLLADLPPAYRSQYVTTRTWSENETHQPLLDDLGFQRIRTIENDRGEGVHTVYYGIDVAEYDSD